MANKLAIYNGSLRKLGETPLADLGEDRDARRVLDAAYLEIVQECLEESQLNLSIRAQEFTPDTNTETAWGYTYVYTKPDDWLRTVGFAADQYKRNPSLNYEDRNGKWLTNTNPIYVWYVSNATDHGMNLGAWPEVFNQYVQCRLAYEIAPSVGSVSANKLDRLFQRMEYNKRQASNKDAMEQPATVFPPEGGWAGSRGGRDTAGEGRKARGSLYG